MNKVVIVGRLSKDPEVRYTQSQMAVARFTVATDRAKRKESDNNQPAVDFIDVAAFGKTAEIIEKFFLKGKWILVEGRIQNNNYEDRHGNRVYSYKVIADRIEFVGSKNDSVQKSVNNYEYKVRDNSVYEQSIPEGFAALEEDVPF